MALARLRRFLFVWAIAGVTVGCSEVSGPPAGLGWAAATPDCGPLGEPAVTIYLASEPIESLNPVMPYVRIAIVQPLDALAGHGFPLAGPNAQGAAWYHNTETHIEFAYSGAITISAVEDDNTIAGTVNVVFPHAGRINGEFRAEWMPRTLLCL